MKKSDLKDGMVVELRDERKYVVIGDTFSAIETWDTLNHYDDDLKHHLYTELDIMKVYKTTGKTFTSMFLDVHLDLLWEREENTAIDKLSELFRNNCIENKNGNCNKFNTCSDCKATFVIEHIEEILDLIDVTYIKL